MAAWDDLPAAGELGECSALVRSAEALRFGAPELAVQLARRALVIGAVESVSAGGAEHGVDHVVEQARSLSMRAHAVLTAGLVRVGHHIEAVEPAFTALALAEADGVVELATSVRLDLAACSREVGEPLLGCALLRPVLETMQPRPAVRAIALGRLVGCAAHVGRRDDVEDALAEADRLLASDDSLSPDARRMERARLAVRAAAYHRWYGDTEDAVDAAREGIGQLNRLRGKRPETDRLRAQLVLELVCALLDEGELGEAESVSVALLAEPVRATSAAPIGQLMLAVSTRVHLPSGRVDRGRGLLDQASWVADRHGLDGLLADTLTVVSQLDEHAGRVSDALESLRTARAAEQRRLRATAKAARHILAEVGAATDWDVQAANALLRDVARPTVQPVAAPVSSISPQHTPAHVEIAETDEATGLLSREGLFRRLRAVRNGERPVALTLVRLGETGTRTGINLTELAGRVRGMAPKDAELARSDGTELAVLLPHTTRDQAEEFAQSIRETAIESNWLSEANAQSIATGVGQSNPDASTVDARALLTAARHALTPAEPARQPGERTQPVHATTLTAEALAELQDVGDTLRIGRSIISSLSIPTGSGGKRRAETGTHPKLPPNPETPATPHASPTTPAESPAYPGHHTPPGHTTSNSPRPTTDAAGHDSPPPTNATSDPAGNASPSAARSTGEPVGYDSPSATQSSGEHADYASPAAARSIGEPVGYDSPPPAGATSDPAGNASPSAAQSTGEHAGFASSAAARSTGEHGGYDSPPPAGATGEHPGYASSSGAQWTTEPAGSGSSSSLQSIGDPSAAPRSSTDPAGYGSQSADVIGGAAHPSAGTSAAWPRTAEPASSSATGHQSASESSEGAAGGTGSSRSVGETGGYRPLVSFSQGTQPPAQSGRETDEPGGSRSSYEETRAELARLMSVLESGSLPDASSTSPTPTTESASHTSDPTHVSPPPESNHVSTFGAGVAPTDANPAAGSHQDSAGGSRFDSRQDSALDASRDSAVEPLASRDSAEPPRGAAYGVSADPEGGMRWSFGTAAESASLPAPARPGDDYPPGTVSQSVPVPPTPEEVPEPPQRPEVPEPADPDPIPMPPTEPGPAVPEEPGPQPPAHSGGRRRGERTSDTIAGLLAEALVAYQETSQEDRDELDAREEQRDSRFRGQQASPDARQDDHSTWSADSSRRDDTHGAQGDQDSWGARLRAHGRDSWVARSDDHSAPGEQDSRDVLGAWSVSDSDGHGARSGQDTGDSLGTRDTRDPLGTRNEQDVWDARRRDDHVARDESGASERQDVQGVRGEPGAWERSDGHSVGGERPAWGRPDEQSVRSESDAWGRQGVQGIGGGPGAWGRPDEQGVGGELPARERGDGQSVGGERGAWGRSDRQGAGGERRVWERGDGQGAVDEPRAGARPDEHGVGGEQRVWERGDGQGAVDEPRAGARPDEHGVGGEPGAWERRDGQSAGVESAGPGAGEELGVFDRLFDWRYQSPASGRHRSPE